MSINDLYAPKFTFEQLADAIKFPSQTLRSWKNSDFLALDEDHDVEGKPGIAAKLSLLTCFKIALAAELIDSGLDLDAAFEAAEAFSDEAREMPGTLFRNGETILVVRKRRADRRARARIPHGPHCSAEVINSKGGSVRADMLFRDESGALTLVDCKMVCESVASKLGGKPVYDR